MSVAAESLSATCRYCGALYAPCHSRQVTCGAVPCQSKRKWEQTKASPVRLVKARANNAQWCARVRGVKERNVWLAGSPAFGEYLPGGGFTLAVSPIPKWPIELRNTRALHGMVTKLMGIPHDSQIAQFTLTPWPCPFGWGLYSQHCDVMQRLAGKTHDAVLFDRGVQVKCGHLARIKAPVVTRRGRRRLRIDAVTPVIVRDSSTSTRSTYTAPTADNLHSTLAFWLPRRIDVDVTGEAFPLELATRETEAATVETGGKFGNTRGWTGHVIVETNAIGHWLLEVAARIGLGGRVALGFGRVRVSEVE